MRVRLSKRIWSGALLSTGGLLAGAAAPVFGQCPCPQVTRVPVTSCPPSWSAPLTPPGIQPAPLPGQTPAPLPGQPSTTQPGQTPTPQTPVAAPAAEPTLGTEQASAVGGGTVALAAPNMLGHLLLASRSINFRYNRASGPVNVANNGSTGFVNPSVADDNSPLPEDRVGFRFNYYDRAQQVTGFGLPSFASNGVGTAFAATKNYNVYQYTFNAEKTFLDGQASVELRVPFATGLSSNLNLSAGSVTGTNTDGSFNVAATPGQTLGTSGTQFGDMTLIFKGVAYSTETLTLSGGLAVGIPSGNDTSVNIIDYSGGTTQGVATVQRDRLIHIDNETWSLSPFVAFLCTPGDRFFTQGFVQLDFPLNESTVHYTETTPRGSITPLPSALVSFPTLNPPFSTRSQIQEQPLLQLDWGTGYWLLRDETRSWITGIAPTFELHYTTTLKNASIVTLPADNLLQISSTNSNRLVQEQPPRVGNLNNRVDIFDATLGTTFVISNRATLATGVSLPLLGGDNRTFDWEAHFQLNWYFGSGKSRRALPPPAPNF